MIITSKYTGTCLACQKPIAVGEKVCWVKGRKGIEHAACSAEAGEAKKIETAIEASRAVDADVQIPVPEGLAYLPFQRAGIAYALARRGTLFGDEMGLGKTVQAIGVINADEAIKSVLVIAPKSLTINWTRELAHWQTRGLEVGRANGTVPGTPIVVVSYEEAKKHEEALCARNWDLVIVDEAHYIKNSRSQRSKTVTAIGKTARKVLALTGTPLPNRPIELFPVLKLVDPDDWDQGPKGGFFRFAKRYANAHHNGYGWDFSGAANLPELQERLRATCMVRRLKGDVLTELPAKRRQVVVVPANGAGTSVRAESEAWDRQADQIEELQARVELARAGTESEYEAAVGALRQATQAAFSEMARLRHDTAISKAPAVAEHVRLALEDDEEAKIVVMAHHHDVIDALVAELADFGPVVLTGETKIEDRQAAVDRFQTDPKCRVFVGSITAAGVGITLTASAHVVFAELDWVPGNVTQAEDRCHRIGQSESVLVQHLVLDGSLDARMAHVLVEKQRVADLGLDKQVVNEPVIPGRQTAATSTSRKEIDEIAERLTEAEIAEIHEGLRRLAGVCDGARTWDGHGFNKLDTRIGHELAERPSLTKRQAALGWKLCRKYRRQLGAEGTP
jgi:SWI/SNF-related matrix-associated actin-dependent regulator 1 of chromatin subfamily A